MPNERNESFRQLRVTDPDGQPIGWNPMQNSLPPSHYAVPTNSYHPSPPYTGAIEPSLGAILQGGLGAPHEPTREQLMVEAIINWRNKLSSNGR